VYMIKGLHEVSFAGPEEDHNTDQTTMHIFNILFWIACSAIQLSKYTSKERSMSDGP
jgi:hypothetical protein